MRRLDLTPTYWVKCPSCGEVGNVTMRNAGHFWLANTVWRCGYCGDEFRRGQLQDEPASPPLPPETRTEEGEA